MCPATNRLTSSADRRLKHMMIADHMAFWQATASRLIKFLPACWQHSLSTAVAAAAGWMEVCCTVTDS
jgi:hypothetical protein